MAENFSYPEAGKLTRDLGDRVGAATGVLYWWGLHSYDPVPVVWGRCFYAGAVDAPAYRGHAGGRMSAEKFAGKCQ